MPCIALLREIATNGSGDTISAFLAIATFEADLFAKMASRTLAYVFFLAQVVWIFVQQPMETRFCSWAMYSCWGNYSYSVSVDGVLVKSEEFNDRYGFAMQGSEGRSFIHNFILIKQYEIVRRPKILNIKLFVNDKLYRVFNFQQ